VVEEVEGM
jgi:hypothetical protein